MNDEVWGVEVSVDLKSCDPAAIRDPDGVRSFVNGLCGLLLVKKYGECQVADFGGSEKVAGITFVQMIDASLISGHLVNSTNAAYLNVFSCKEFDAKKVADYSRSFFRATHAEFIVNYRMM